MELWEYECEWSMGRTRMTGEQVICDKGDLKKKEEHLLDGVREMLGYTPTDFRVVWKKNGNLTEK